MSRLSRAEVIDPSEMTIVHVICRTVPRCFLLGDDPISGKNFDHRKVWIEERRDAFLAKLTIDEANDPIGVVASQTGCRCSDKGFLTLQPKASFELLDWTARQIVVGKSGSTPMDTPPVLQQLGLKSSSWCELVMRFEESFCHLAGRCDRIDAVRSHCTQRRFRVRSRTRELLPSPV